MSSEYDVLNPKGRRKAPSGIVKGEDAILTTQKRRAMQSALGNIERNFAVAGFAIRKHLDYVTQFNFQSQTGDEVFDREFEHIVNHEWSAADNFEWSGRFCRETFVRMMEGRAIGDGDCGAMFLKSGHVQGVESDLIRNPDHRNTTRKLNVAELDKWVNGVRPAPGGRPKWYSLCKRGTKGIGYEFDRIVSAKNFHLHGYFTRFDQHRGVSPLTAGAATLQDVYEGIDYGLGKLKVEQLVAMAIYRESMVELPRPPGDEEKTEDEREAEGYQIDFNRGPALLDLDPGDRAEMLTTGNPSENTREFLMVTIMIALKSLDIPYSFFDESHTNFFGSRAAWIHYERSCIAKRNRVVQFLNRWLRWRIVAEAIKGRITIPKGFDIHHPWWDFIPTGVPWWNPVDEVNASIIAISAGLDTPQNVVRRHNLGTGDFYENLREIERANKLAKEKNVTLTYQVMKSQEPNIPN